MIPAVIADSWFFCLAIIDGLAAVYILPTVIAIARQAGWAHGSPGTGWLRFARGR